MSVLCGRFFARPLLAILALLASSSVVSAASITINVGIPGDIPIIAPYNNANAGWFIAYNDGPAGVNIDSVAITLDGGLYLRPGFCVLFGCGFLPVPAAGIGDPGFAGTDPATITTGLTAFTLNFSDFNPGELFKYIIDIDDSDNPDNVVKAIDFLLGNNAVNYAISLSGPGYAPTTLTGTLDFTQFINVSTLPNSSPTAYARATINADINPVPEPATAALLGTALLGLGFWKRSRS